MRRSAWTMLLFLCACPRPPSTLPTAIADLPIRIPPGCEANLGGEWRHVEDPTFRYHFEDDGEAVTVWVYRVFKPMDGGAPSRIFPRPLRPAPDAGGRDGGPATTDAGTVKTDAGTVKTDAGTLKTDAGTLKTDAGTLKTDAGTLKTDAGTLKTDAGTLKTDAGIASPDAGAHWSDAGSIDAGPPWLEPGVDAGAGPDTAHSGSPESALPSPDAQPWGPGETGFSRALFSFLGQLADGGLVAAIDGGAPASEPWSGGTPVSRGEPPDGGVLGAGADHTHPFPVDLIPSDGGTPPLAIAVIHLRRTSSGFIGEAETRHFLPSGRECRATFPTRIAACTPSTLNLVSAASTPVGEGCQTPVMPRPAALLEHRLARSNAGEL